MERKSHELYRLPTLYSLFKNTKLRFYFARNTVNLSSPDLASTEKCTCVLCASGSTPHILHRGGRRPQLYLLILKEKCEQFSLGVIWDITRLVEIWQCSFAMPDPRSAVSATIPGWQVLWGAMSRQEPPSLQDTPLNSHKFTLGSQMLMRFTFGRRSLQRLSGILMLTQEFISACMLRSG